MASAYDSIPRTAALAIIGLVAASAVAAAGGTANVGARKASNSFTLLQPAAPQVAGTTPSAGTGIASSKQIILNPYHVPLIQNAGSLSSGR